MLFSAIYKQDIFASFKNCRISFCVLVYFALICLQEKRVIWKYNSHSLQRVFTPPPTFQIIPLLKKFLIPLLPKLFFQPRNVVMLIVSAKSWSTRGASHQPAVMISCVCPVYLVEGLVIVFLVLLKWEVAAILGNVCGVQGQTYVT